MHVLYTIGKGVYLPIAVAGMTGDAILPTMTFPIGILWGGHGKLTPTLLIFTKVDSHAIFGQLSRRSIFLEGAGFIKKHHTEKR